MAKRGYKATPLLERLGRKIESKKDGHWFWRSKKSKEEYFTAKIDLDGKTVTKSYYAWAYYYQFKVFPVRDHKVVTRCSEKNCISPHHNLIEARKDNDRNEEIYSIYKKQIQVGNPNFSFIGKKFNLTGQRIKDIISELEAT